MRRTLVDPKRVARGRDGSGLRVPLLPSRQGAGEEGDRDERSETETSSGALDGVRGTGVDTEGRTSGGPRRGRGVCRDGHDLPL